MDDAYGQSDPGGSVRPRWDRDAVAKCDSLGRGQRRNKTERQIDLLPPGRTFSLTAAASRGKPTYAYRRLQRAALVRGLPAVRRTVGDSCHSHRREHDAPHWAPYL